LDARRVRRFPEVDPTPIEGEEAGVFVDEYRSIRVIYDLF